MLLGSSVLFLILALTLSLLFFTIFLQKQLKTPCLRTCNFNEDYFSSNFRDWGLLSCFNASLFHYPFYFSYFPWSPDEEKARFHGTVLRSLLCCQHWSPSPVIPCQPKNSSCGFLRASERCKKRETPAVPTMQLLIRSCFSITGNFLKKIVNRKEKK